MYPISSSERSPRHPIAAAPITTAAGTSMSEERPNESRLRGRFIQAASRSNNATAVVGETRFVIGLDFGTTYTGIAFAETRGTDCALSRINVITNWGEGMKNHDKVPSVLSYTPSTADYQQWGSSLSPDAYTLIHKKLELCPQSLKGELALVIQALKDMHDLNFDRIVPNKNNDVPVSACKTPEEVVTDYLKKIYAYLNQTVEEFTDAYRRHTTTDLVVTVPTNWPYEALNSTYRAVVRAGFSRENFPKLNDILFITESEASARYTVRYYKEQHGIDFLYDNSYFVLCDAGGGTVDVVSYRVLQTYPTLQLEQIGRPSGDKCGSIFINREFKKWLRFNIGENYYRCLDPNLSLDKVASHETETPAMRKLMDEFDYVKESFQAHDTRPIQINLPKPLDNLTVGGVAQDGVLFIQRGEMEQFFDRCLERIMDLVKQHMRQIEHYGHGKAKNLFLVGGFGSSEYLKYYLRETMKEYSIKFCTPDTSWTAIVRGAVVCGVDNAQIPSIRRAKPCPCSYGISLDEKFRPSKHAIGSPLQTRNGQQYVQEQMSWLLHEGDVILANEPRKQKKEFDVKFSKGQERIRLPIYSHTRREDEDAADRPTRLTDSKNEVERIAVLEIDLQILRDCMKGKYPAQENTANLYQDVEFRRAMKSLTTLKYDVTLELALELSWDRIRMSVRWGGMRLVEQIVALPDPKR